MSLTQFINCSPVFQDMIKEFLPKSEEFFTLTNKKAFSSEYDYLVASPNLNSVKSSIVGNAFDYLARFAIAKIVLCSNQDTPHINTVAESGLARLRHNVSVRLFDKFNSKFEAAKIHIEQFINGELSVDDIIDFTIYMGKLDLIFRSGGILPAQGAESILISENDIIGDVMQLYNVFVTNFVSKKVTKYSSVTFNPHFGYYSRLIGGADGDIIIDDTLYDFKTTISHGYNWKQIAQIVSYYAMNELNLSSKTGIFLNNKSETRNIRYIAIYHARYGEISLYDTNSWGEKRKILLNAMQDFFEKLENNRDFYIQCFEKRKTEKIKITSEMIKKYRKDNNLTQNALANIIGVSQKTIKCWENNYSTPSYQNLIKIRDLIKSNTC